MGLRASVARKSVEVSGRLSGSSIGQVTPVRQFSSLLANRVVPALVEFAFNPGVQDVNGVQLMIPPGMAVGPGGEHHMALGTYEMGEVRYVLGRLRPGGGMVDVGAHIGYFALPAAKVVGPTGTVIAVEPTQSSVAALRWNTSLNGFDDRVKVVEAAASDTIGTATLHVSSTSQMWNTLEPDTLNADDADDADATEVATVTVDDLLEQAGWPPIQVLKMDVEGHERSVLRGAAQTLDRYPEMAVLFEASGTSQYHYRMSLDTIEHLAELGYEFSVVDKVGRDTPADVETLKARMRMPRWQDALLNVVAHRH